MEDTMFPIPKQRKESIDAEKLRTLARSVAIVFVGFVILLTVVFLIYACASGSWLAGSL
jgi:hypothetical protein